MHLKAVILLGGPQKGTRFRPLSLDLPKPLFPIAGFPMVQHHIEACSKLQDVTEIYLVGFYQPNDALTRFIRRQKQSVNKPISYLQEYTMLGTAGCLHHFRDVITNGEPDGIIVMYSDAFCDFPLEEMLAFKKKFMQCLILSAEVPVDQSLNYGCLGIHHATGEVIHYIDKPETFVSRDINGGVYILTTEIIRDIGRLMLRQSKSMPAMEGDDECTFDENNGNSSSKPGRLFFETDIFPKLYSEGKLFAYKTEKFWMSIKSAGSALYANRAILESYKDVHPDRLSHSSSIIGNVFIHKTAEVDPSAILGPNVSIGAGVVIGKGVRVKNSIVLEGSILKDHCCILHSIIAWHSVVGEWARVEGTPTELDPNAPHATTDNFYLFDDDGRLRPSITILGRDVVIPPEVVIRNSIVMPNKVLTRGFKNQILL